MKSHGRSSLHVRDFPFNVGDLVLVKWSDGMVYFAKIKRIDHKRRKCTVVFDDKSQDEAHFNQIHSGRRLYGRVAMVIYKSKFVWLLISGILETEQWSVNEFLAQVSPTYRKSTPSGV